MSQSNLLPDTDCDSLHKFQVMWVLHLTAATVVTAAMMTAMMTVIETVIPVLISDGYKVWVIMTKAATLMINNGVCGGNNDVCTFLSWWIRQENCSSYQGSQNEFEHVQLRSITSTAGCHYLRPKSTDRGGGGIWICSHNGISSVCLWLNLLSNWRNWGEKNPIIILVSVHENSHPIAHSLTDCGHSFSGL